MLQWAPAGLLRTERASPAMAGRMCLATLATAKSPIFSSQEMQIACFKAIFSQAERAKQRPTLAEMPEK